MIPLLGIWATPWLAGGSLFLWLLGPVTGSPLPSILHAFGIQGTTDEVVADARKVLDPAAPDEDDRVLLQVMADSGDIARDFDIIGQTDSSHLAESGVGFFRCGGKNSRADTSFLRAILQSRRLALVVPAGSAFPN
jgi:hypothetical protein